MKTLSACIALMCCSIVGHFITLAQDGFRSLKTVHLDVNYEAGVSEGDARNIADYLQGDYEFLRKKLGIELKKRLEVRIFESPNRFFSESKQRGKWRIATFQHGVLFVQNVRESPEQHKLQQSLSYELALAVLSDAAAGGCPNWLREAFAVYYSGEMTELAAPVGLTLSYFTDLDQNIQQHSDPPRRNDVHYVLGTTMRFFVDTFGDQKAFGVFKAFNGMKSVEDVFASVFGQEFGKIERSWADHIAYVTTSIKRPR
jgi:hypothetical protein